MFGCRRVAVVPLSLLLLEKAIATDTTLEELKASSLTARRLLFSESDASNTLRGLDGSAKDALRTALNAMFMSSTARMGSSDVSFMNQERTQIAIAIVVGLSCFLLLLLGLLCFCLRRQGQVAPLTASDLYSSGGSKENLPPTVDLSFFSRAKDYSRADTDIRLHTPIHFVRFIKRAEVLWATRNFDEKLIVGRGANGTVYKGKGPSGSVWAVKRAHRLSSGSNATFQNEVDLVSRMNHGNLVGLLGYCTEAGERILVYEYVSNGTLRQHLDVDEMLCSSPLTFGERLEIALGVARGLHYLHTCAKDPICHGNLTTDKILLDGSNQPKLSDFGFSKTSSTENNMSATTFGYIDPDYSKSGMAMVHNDVYRYGVVLFELLTGQHPLLDRGGRKLLLVKWANEKILAQQLDLLVDPMIDSSSCSMDALSRLARLARRCTFSKPQERPEMYDVVQELEDMKAELIVEIDQDAIWDYQLPEDDVASVQSPPTADSHRSTII